PGPATRIRAYARLMSRGRGASGTGGAASAVIAIGSSSAVVQLLRSLARATTDPHQCPPRIDHGRARRTPAASPVTAGPPERPPHRVREARRSGGGLGRAGGEGVEEGGAEEGHLVGVAGQGGAAGGRQVRRGGQGLLGGGLADQRFVE